MSGAEIRPVVAADLPAVAGLTGSPERAAARLRAAGRGDDSMWVAVLSGAVAGAASIRWSADCDPPHPWLYGLQVAPSLHRKGIGRTLVRAAEATARDRGATHLSLDADVDDARAAAFYRALGYSVVRPHDHHWRSVHPVSGEVLAEGTAPTFVMRRPLASGTG